MSGDFASAAPAPKVAPVAAVAAAAPVAVVAPVAQKTADLIFQPPKPKAVQLDPEDLLAVYHPASQGIILVTRRQYDKGDLSTPAPVVSAPAAVVSKPAAAASPATQKTSDLIFQAPKVGPIKLCPDDLLAVYDAASQDIILVTRKQYDSGDISTPAAATSKPAAASSATQRTSDLIFQAPKVGPITLSP